MIYNNVLGIAVRSSQNNYDACRSRSILCFALATIYLDSPFQFQFQFQFQTIPDPRDPKYVYANLNTRACISAESPFVRNRKFERVCYKCARIRKFGAAGIIHNTLRAMYTDFSLAVGRQNFRFHIHYALRASQHRASPLV